MAEPAQRIVESDADKLGAAYGHHRGALLRLAVLLAGRQDVAEDLVQEAFSRAAERLPTLSQDAQRAYLRATVLNLWRNRLRRLAMERRVRHEPLAVEEVAFEERDRLWAAVRRLPARRRACLVLRYYEDLSERETAALLGCSVGTVKSQTSKALRQLKQELGDEDRG